ncbi:helix-turn-helix domain-containing protein [Microvirga sp. CF3062]|uniref:helix-turn-helix domain-containing protein n=1 Tax=Microvirga sp. CF3062 TaxID=3110182 RepID=UPI002E778F51|nr:helix-turn-helix domain-containing protein [Microvirga sp. CF3062]MEE1656480.1 helix-turn-helix domain-containing protein [Microvirga sp. CF3062]
MTSTIAGAYIDKLKAHFSVRKDEELAQRIAVGKSTIASWRQRGTIPLTSRMKLEELTGVSYQETQREFVADVGEISHLIEAGLNLALIRLGSKLSPDSYSAWAIWLSLNRRKLLDLIFEDQNEGSGERNMEGAVTRTFLRIANNQLLTPEQLLQLRASASED